MAPHAAEKSLERKLHLAKGIPPDNCQDRQCNPLLLTIHKPQDLDSDPVERLDLNLIKDKTSPIVATPDPEGNNEPELPHNDPRLVTVTEIKDLKRLLK